MRFVARRYSVAAGRSALDLGCGGGANTWFLAREGFSVTGIDGSPTAIKQTLDLLVADGLRANLLVGDLVALPLANETFDCVIDVSSIQHNGREESLRIADHVHRVLRSGGWFFSMLVGTETTGGGSGISLGDGSYRDIPTGPLAGVGRVRLYAREDVSELMRRFRSVSIDRSDRTDRGGEYRVSHWVASAMK